MIREPDQVFGVWRLDGPDGAETVKVRGSLTANNGEIIHRWALDGHGIMLRSLWDVGEALAAGRLERVLPRMGNRPTSGRSTRRGSPARPRFGYSSRSWPADWKLGRHHCLRSIRGGQFRGEAIPSPLTSVPQP